MLPEGVRVALLSILGPIWDPILLFGALFSGPCFGSIWDEISEKPPRLCLGRILQSLPGAGAADLKAYAPAAVPQILLS